MWKLVLGFALALLAAAPAYALDGTELLKKVDRNLEPESYESYRKLINIEPNGSQISRSVRW